MTTQHNTSVLTVDKRDQHHGVTKRAAGHNEPGFAVYRGSTESQVMAHFFDEADALEYAKFMNRNDAP